MLGTVLIVTRGFAEGDDLTYVLAAVAQHSGCRLLPPAGPVVISEAFRVPSDLRRFHELCGGALLFEGAPFEWRVSGPQQLVPASPRLLGPELAQETAIRQPDDVTNACFIFADTGEGSAESMVVVDLHPARGGRYYDAFWDSYGVVGQMPVLAFTVADIMWRLLETHGEHVPQPEPGNGDAYDLYYAPDLGEPELDKP